MRTALIHISLLSLLLAGCVGQSQSPSAPVGDFPPNTRVLTMRASGMFCTGCSGAVEAAVQQFPGVLSVSADIGTKHVVVYYDPAYTTWEGIFQHGLFDAYGREFVSDETYSP
jgi:copper chaperone CopZ